MLRSAFVHPAHYEAGFFAPLVLSFLEKPMPARKLRVVHCLEAVHSGGVEQRRLSLARLLDEDRYEQLLLCTKNEGPLRDQFAAAGCPVHEIGVYRAAIDRARYARALESIRAFQP